MSKTATKKPVRTSTTPYDVAEHLRTPEEMAAYLDAWLEEAPDDAAGIARALGDIARAKGMTQVAKDAGLSRESLYRALSAEGNPTLATVLKVAKALGLRLHAEAAYPPVAPAPAVPPPGAHHDNVVVLEGFTWDDFQRMLTIRGDRSAPRLSYLEGRVEIMSPSRPHESLKSRLGRLVETWCLENDVEFDTVGSWTIGDRAVERAVEPDECYVFGDADDPERPDLAIEVVWTSGGLDKLEVYRKLDVREVWFWRDGRLTVHLLRGDRYVESPRSDILPDLDLAELVRHLGAISTSAAIRDFRRALRERDRTDR